MHILATSSATLDDLIEPVDLRQAPADMVALSFTDSDLSALATAWRAEGEAVPSLRLASLRELRHPMSVDLWLDSVAAQAKVILVRILGGYDWWRYGCDRLAEIARQKGIALALLPGECRETDERLAALSTVSPEEQAGLLAYFREGGTANMRALLRRMAMHAGHDIEAEPATPLPKAGFYCPGLGAVDAATALAARPDGAATVPLLFYRSMLLAEDVAPIDRLSEAMAARGVFAMPLFVSSLKDPAVRAFVLDTTREQAARAIVITTAFASGAEPGAARLSRPGQQARARPGGGCRGPNRGLSEAPGDAARKTPHRHSDARLSGRGRAHRLRRRPRRAGQCPGHARRPEDSRL